TKFLKGLAGLRVIKRRWEWSQSEIASMSAFGLSGISHRAMASAIRADRRCSILATIVFTLINDRGSTHDKRVHLLFEGGRIFECDVVPNLPTTGDNRLTIKNFVPLNP